MEQFAHGWVTGAENRHKSSLVQAGKSEEAAVYVRRIREANVVAAEEFYNKRRRKPRGQPRHSQWQKNSLRGCHEL